MTKFQIGDILQGKSTATIMYRITTKDCLVRVVETQEDGNILIKLLEIGEIKPNETYEGLSYNIGKDFVVSEKHFKKTTMVIVKNKGRIEIDG